VLSYSGDEDNASQVTGISSAMALGKRKNKQIVKEFTGKQKEAILFSGSINIGVKTMNY